MIDGIVVDNFAGGGGASTGIEAALGRPIDFAINHDRLAIAMHRVNHPQTRHFQSNVWDIDPRALARGRRVSLGWFSPDCTFHSKARGGKPFRDPNKARRTRGLAGLVPRWADAVNLDVIMMENVEEFSDWGPLNADGTPNKLRKGVNFRRWIRQIENLGYQIDMRELSAHHYGAPTSRNRLFVIARRDGHEIVFPEAIHGPGLLPYRTAAECIDWSIPCPSIFERKKPLAEATLRRIARGIMRYVVNSADTFIVPIKHCGDDRVHGLYEPTRTITCANRGELALIAPTLINTRNGERKGQAPRVRDIQGVYPTVTAKGSQGAVVAAFLARHYGGHENDGSGLRNTVHTVTTKDHHALVSSSIIKFKGTCRDGHPVTDPLHVIQAGGLHYGEVRAFLLKYYGTDQNPRLTNPLGVVTTKDRFALVTVHGQEYVIVDIGMRMLSPRELFRAQGFGDDYIIDHGVDDDGSIIPLTKTAQVHLCGNSVCPPVAKALVEANMFDREQEAAA